MKSRLSSALQHRTIRTPFAVVGPIVLVVMLLIGGFFWYLTPPTDVSLERRFYRHRADFEEIANMMEEDVHMTRVAQSFTRDDTWDSDHPEHRQISDERWNQYRKIFRRAGVPMGTERDDADDVEIAVWAVGLSIGGSSLSYVHCGNAVHTYESSYLPCFERKESGQFEDDDRFIRYKRIESDWYIFEFDT